MFAPGDRVVAITTVIPMREYPDEASQMVSQLLLGEVARVLASDAPEGWIRVESVLDGYPGYVNVHTVRPEPETWQEDEHMVRFLEPVSLVRLSGETWMLPMGARVRWLGGERLEMPDLRVGEIMPSVSFVPEVQLKHHIESRLGKKMLRIAKRLLGTPYLWAGRSSFGIDCSGLVQLSALMNGVILPRDAQEQYKMGEPVPPDIEALEKGDLLFFASNKKEVTHVGIYAGKGRFIHASGWVRWSDLIEGAPHFEPRYLETLIGARRLTPSTVVNH